MADLSMTADP